MTTVAEEAPVAFDLSGEDGADLALLFLAMGIAGSLDAFGEGNLDPACPQLPPVAEEATEEMDRREVAQVVTELSRCYPNEIAEGLVGADVPPEGLERAEFVCAVSVTFDYLGSQTPEQLLATITAPPGNDLVDDAVPRQFFEERARATCGLTDAQIAAYLDQG